MNTIVPIYVKNGDLPIQTGMNTHLTLCQIVNQHVPGQTLGAQLVRDVWSIWLKDIRAREYMTTIIKAIDINGRTVDVHDIYPTSKSIPNEKVVFKDIPFSVNDKIIKFLNDQPGITVKSGVISARIRDNDNKLTPFYNGYKFVYVKGLFSPSIHNTCLVDNNKCRVWHKSQEKSCARCRHTDHTSLNTEKCEAYTAEQDALSICSPKKYIV